MEIKDLDEGEYRDALKVLNEAAKAYGKVLQADAYKEPQMTYEEFLKEASRVKFLTVKLNGEVIGVMGYEYVGDVALIRHGYVKPSHQRKGIGSLLLREIEDRIRKEGRVRRLIVGMYRDAYWAVSFWSKHGFRLAENSNELLMRYYDIPSVQRINSIAMWKDLDR